MEINNVIGIDVSKLVLDVVVHNTKAYKQFENSNAGFKKLCQWALKESMVEKDKLLFAFEHTGLYSYQLAIHLSNEEFCFSMIPGLEIKRSLGISRGKDDRIDAAKIARYAYRIRDEIRQTHLPEKDIDQLKSLLNLRDRMVRQRAGYKVSLSEMKRVKKIKDNQTLFDAQTKLITSFNKQIASLEAEMIEILMNNTTLANQFNLATSIVGIGPQTALYMIVLTCGFTKFKDSRSFASYSGIAPFPHISGTSIRGKTKVSNLANKKMKSLFDLAAKSAVQFNVEMKLYYNKRIEEGKPKMSTINIIRNKLLSRVFAVIRRGTPYVEILKYAS